MSEISREEIVAFTEANTKLAVVLDKIAGSLESIFIKQDKMSDNLANVVSDDIISGVNNHYSIVHKETMGLLERLYEGHLEIKGMVTNKLPEIVTEKIKNSDLSRDMEHIKWLVGIVGMVIVVSAVILRVAGDTTNNKSIESQNRYIEHLMAGHEMKTTKEIQHSQGEPNGSK